MNDEIFKTFTLLKVYDNYFLVFFLVLCLEVEVVLSSSSKSDAVCVASCAVSPSSETYFLSHFLAWHMKSFLLTNTFPTYEQMPIQSLFAGHHLLVLWAHERGVIIMFPCYMGLSIAKFICAISTGLNGIFLVLIATSVDIKLQMNTVHVSNIFLNQTASCYRKSKCILHAHASPFCAL